MKPFLLIVMGIIFFANCRAEDMTSQSDANSTILSAVSYKARSCSLPIPQPLLLALDDVPTRNLLLCTTAIIQTDCPFLRYPIACALIYVKKPLNELPPLIPFEVYVDTKL